MKELVYVLGLLVTVGALLMPQRKQALLFLTSFFFVFTVGWVFYHYTGIFMYDMPILALFIYGIGSSERFRFYLPGVSLVFFLFMAWILITAIPATNPGWAVAEFSKFLRGYIVFVSYANLVRTRQDYRAVLLGLMVGLGVEFFLAVWQWRIGPPPFRFLNLMYHRWRATGTFYVPHYLGNYLVLLVPLFIRLAAFYRARTLKENIQYAVFSGFGLLSLLVTFARGAWVAFGSSMAIMFIFSMTRSKYKSRVKWAFNLFVAMGMVFMVHYISTIQSQFSDDRNTAYEVRFDQFRVAQRIIRDKPLMGTGLGNYRLVSYDYLTSMEKRDNRAYQYAYMVHNSYLYITAQMGIPGGILFILTLLKFFQLGMRGLRVNDPFSINVFMAIMTGLLGMCIAFLSAPDIRSEQLVVQIYMGGGLMYALLQSNRIAVLQARLRARHSVKQKKLPYGYR